MAGIKKYLIVATGMMAFFAFGVEAQTTDGRVPLRPAPNSGASANIQAKVNRLEAGAKTRMSEVRAELQGKISAIQDARRKDAALAIIGQLAHANATATDHFNDILNHLERVLAKVESRAEKARASGGNITAVAMAIQKARDSIAQARTAVQAQAKKSYQTAINARAIVSSDASTSEGQNALISSMREQFQSARNSLKKDIFALRDGPMKNARRAVQDAIKSLKEVSNVDATP